MSGMFFFETHCMSVEYPWQSMRIRNRIRSNKEITIRILSVLGIAIPDCFSNPGISGLKNTNPGIPGLNPGIESRDWVPDFELVKSSSNSLFWSHDEFLNLDLSAGVLFWHIIMWIVVNIFTFLVSCRMIQFHHYLM